MGAIKKMHKGGQDMGGAGTGKESRQEQTFDPSNLMVGQTSLLCIYVTAFTAIKQRIVRSSKDSFPRL